MQLLRPECLTKHFPPPMRVLSFFRIFCRVYNCYLRYRSTVLSPGCDDRYIPDSFVFSWINFRHSSYCPFSANRVVISDHNYVVNSNITGRRVPFLSRKQRRENITCSAAPERINNLLHEFYTLTRIFSFTKRTLWYLWRGSSE